MIALSPKIYCIAPQNSPSIPNIEMISLDRFLADSTFTMTDHSPPMVFCHRDMLKASLKANFLSNKVKVIDRPVTFWERDHIFSPRSDGQNFIVNRLRERVLGRKYPGVSMLYKAYTKRRLRDISALKTTLFMDDIRVRAAELGQTDVAHVIPDYSLYIPTHRHDNILLIKDNILRQAIKPKNIAIGVHGSKRHFEAMRRAMDDIEGVKVINMSSDKTVGLVLNRLIEACTGELVLKMDDDDVYGPFYARDMILSYLATKAPMSGKAPEAIYFEKSDASYIRYAGRRSRNIIASVNDICTGAASVSGATLGGVRSHFLAYPYDEQAKMSVDSVTFEKYKTLDFKIAIDDGSQVLTLRGADKTGHRWKISDEDLQKRALFFSQGQSRLWSGVRPDNDGDV